MINSSLVLAHRTLQIFEGRVKRNVSIVTLISLLMLTIAWILGIQDVKSHWQVKGAQAWKEGACQLDGVKPSFPIKFGMVSLSFVEVELGDSTPRRVYELTWLPFNFIASPDSSFHSHLIDTEWSIHFLKEVNVDRVSERILAVSISFIDLQSCHLDPFGPQSQLSTGYRI